MYVFNGGLKRSFFRSVLLVLASLIGIATILASGGGGGGGSARVPPTVNYSVLPTTLLAMSTSADNTSVTDAALGAALSEGQMYLDSIGSLIDLVITLFSIPDGSYTTACPGGGTETIAATVATPGMVSAGDVYTSSWSACAFSGVTLDGSLSMSVVSVGFLNDMGLPPEQRFVGAQLQLDFNNVAVSDASGYVVQDGDMTLSGDDTLGYVRFFLSGTSIAEAINTKTTRLSDYTLWAGTDDLGVLHYAGDYGLASTALAGTIQVATLTPFDTASGQLYPNAGVATVTGAAGNGVKLTTNDSTQVQLDYEFNGSNEFNDLIGIVKNWSELTPMSVTGISTTGPATAPRYALLPLYGVK